MVYLKFKPTDDWWEAFLNQNSIFPDQNDWSISDNAPNWFIPLGNSVRYKNSDDFDQGSRYFRDTVSGISFIYEIQF
ncbi:MAG: hypothetical protein ACYC1Q_10100 [Bacteroidia bacterium]